MLLAQTLFADTVIQSALPVMIGCAVCLPNDSGRRVLLLPEDAYIAS